jgi:SAM-dependent methyltransferase
MTAELVETVEATAETDGRRGAQALAPEQVFLQMATGYWVSQAIYAAAKLGVADMLKGGPRTVEELAAEAGADAPTLYRLMRALSSVGIFAEAGERRFASAPLSKFLESGPGSMRAFVLHILEDPSWEAWGELTGSVRTGETGFARAHEGAGIFDYYAVHPESAVPFNAAMVELSAVVGAAVVEAYDFTPYEKIVDVGGGHGGLLTRVLKAAPAARGVVFDQPHVVEGTTAAMEAEGVSRERFEVAGGDFFEAVTEGGDAYLLKFIVHDWDDERSVTILRNCHRAMRDGGRLLLVETVVPEGAGDAFPKWFDLHMLILTGGRERTATEFRELLARAGFELTRVVPTNSPLCVIEAVKR